MFRVFVDFSFYRMERCRFGWITMNLRIFDGSCHFNATSKVEYLNLQSALYRVHVYERLDCSLFCKLDTLFIGTRWDCCLVYAYYEFI